MARFEGEVHTQWLRHRGPDRRMKLLEDFAFVDDNGVRWEAPAGSVVDGASIPDFLWSTVGSPYVGDYRRASVLHDVACGEKTRPDKDVHRMFYDAMVADGGSVELAKQMYTGLRLFGPRWTVPGARGAGEAAEAPRQPLTIDELEAALDAALGE